MSTLVVVDGPNLVNRVGEFLTKEMPSAVPAEIQRAYYREWFDIDRLVGATLGVGPALSPWTDLGMVIFRSHRAIGRDHYRMKSEELSAFWLRQGTNQNAAVMLVEIPGGPSGPGDDKEKGIDMSMAVYLFETLEQWQTAVLVTNDTDFVPAVWSLRRKGKRVHCISRKGPGSAPLAAACQHFLPLSTNFLVADRGLFEVTRKGAAFDQFFERCMARYTPHQHDRMAAPPGVLVSGTSVLFTHPYCAIDSAIEELNVLFDGTPFLAHAHSEQACRIDARAPGLGTFVAEGLTRHMNASDGATWRVHYQGPLPSGV